MDPITGGALIAAGSSLLGGALGAAGSSNLNRRNRRHQWDMMLQQQAYNDKVNQQQMDFQREVNQQNFDWNDPSNIRKRVESAGYNPFLYDKQNLGSAQGASLSSFSAGLGTPSELNPGAALGEGIRGAATSFFDTLMKQKEIDAQTSRNDAFDYEMKKQVANDSLEDGGISAYYSSGLTAISQIQSAQAAAKINTVQSTFEQWRQEFYSRNAMDENGKPLVDENGEYVSNYDAEQQSNISRNVLAVEKLQQDILAGEVNIENMEIDQIVKRYDLEFVKPAELDNLKQSLAVMKSNIAANNASAQASLANAYASMQAGLSTNALRRYNVSAASWDAHAKKYNAKIAESQYNYEDPAAASKAWWLNNPVGFHLDPILGSLGQILGGARDAGIAYRTLKGSKPKNKPIKGFLR